MQILALTGKINNFFNNTKVEKKEKHTNHTLLWTNTINSYDLPSSAYSNLFYGEAILFGVKKNQNNRSRKIEKKEKKRKAQNTAQQKIKQEKLSQQRNEVEEIKKEIKDSFVQYTTSQMRRPEKEELFFSINLGYIRIRSKLTPFRRKELYNNIRNKIKEEDIALFNKQYQKALRQEDPVLFMALSESSKNQTAGKDNMVSPKGEPAEILEKDIDLVPDESACDSDNIEQVDSAKTKEIISKIANNEYEEAKKIASDCEEFTKSNNIIAIDDLKQIQELLKLDNIPEHLVRTYLFFEDTNKNGSNLELLSCANDLLDVAESTEQIGSSKILKEMLKLRDNVLGLESKKLDDDQIELLSKIKEKAIEQFSLNFELFLDSMNIDKNNMNINDWSKKFFEPNNNQNRNTVVLFTEHLINFKDIKNKNGSGLSNSDFDQILETLNFLMSRQLEKKYDNDTVEQKIKKQFLELIYDFCLENVDQNTCPFELHKALLQLVLYNDNEASIRSAAKEILFKNAPSCNQKYIESILSKFKTSDKMYNPKFLNDTEKAILTSGISHLAETSFSIPKIATVARILDSAGLKWEDIAMDSLYSQICKGSVNDIANITNVVCTFIKGRPSYRDDVAAINKYPILADVFEANLGKGRFSETLLTKKFNTILEYSKNFSNLANIDQNIYTVNNSQWSQDQKEQFKLCHKVSTLIISLLSKPEENKKINSTFFRKLEKLFGKDEALRTLKDSFAAFFEEMNMNDTKELKRCFSNLPVSNNNNSLESFLENCSYQTLIDILNSANTNFEVNLMKNCIIKILKEKLDNGSIISLQDERYLNTFEQFRAMAGRKIEHGFSYSSDIPEVKEIEPLPLIQRKENLDGYDLLLLNVAEIICTRTGYEMSIPPKELRYFDIVNDESFMMLKKNENGVVVPATAKWQYYAAANTKETIEEIFKEDANDNDIRNKYIPGLKQMVLSGNDAEQNFYRENYINMEAKQGAHRLLGHVDENGKLKFTHLCKKENGKITFYKIVYPKEGQN